MDNSTMYYVIVITILSIIFIKIIYDLGYPLHFKFGVCYIGYWYKDKIDFECYIGTGYIIKKMKFKIDKDIIFDLNVLAEGDFKVSLLDKNKNVIMDFQNENGKEKVDFKAYEKYYLKIKYKNFKGKLNIKWG